MKLIYHWCPRVPAADCAQCSEPVQDTMCFELHRHEYDPFEYDAPRHEWLCSEACVRAWDNREPNE